MDAESVCRGISRKDSAAVLRANRLDLGRFVKGHKREVKRQYKSIGGDGSPKNVCLIVTFAKNHQVDVRCIRLITIDRTEKMPAASASIDLAAASA